MIDTHCHLTFAKLRQRVDEVLRDAKAAGVDRMICVGITETDIAAARGLAEEHDGVFYTTGIHPHYAAEQTAGAVASMIEQGGHGKCVAYGEMGLDYHYDDPPREVQHEALAAQLAAVGSAGEALPIVIHCRKAVDDVLAKIRESGLSEGRFVFHCFTETSAECVKVLDAGCMVSFTGIVTYKNAPEVRAAAKLVPWDRIMVETDAPYLSPEPHRKVRPNEPKFVVDTARFLAELRGVPFEEFVGQTDENAERFFGLGGGA